MANVKIRVNSPKPTSNRIKGTGKVGKLKKLLTGNNDKTRSAIKSAKKSNDKVKYPENSLIKNKLIDTVLIRDSKLRREIQLSKDSLLTKHGRIKHNNKDNLRICNNILKSELLIDDNKEKEPNVSHKNGLNNNNLIVSNQNDREKNSTTKDSMIKKVLDNKSDDKQSKLNKSKPKTSTKSARKPRKKYINTRKPKKGLFECDYCHKQFDTKSSIRRHMYLHLHFKTYPCKQCKKVFRKQLYLSAHVTRQHPNWERHYMCNVCDKPFLLKENLAVHLASHTSLETMFKCIYCKEKFSHQNDLVKHEKKHLVSGRYDCIICEQSYDCRNKLSMHFKTHLRVKDFICQHCGKEFLRMNSMRRHVQICHAGIRIQCSICKKFLKGHLSEHMRTHEKQRPHKCPDCGQCFTQSTQLTVHRRSHSGARPYPCRICNRPFSHSNALMLHIRRHTGEKPFDCAMCPLSFSQLPHMKSHMRKIHGKENPYRCKKCKQFFKLKIDLENHTKNCKFGEKELSFEEKIQASVQVEEEEVVESVMSLSRMRFLLALLLTMIATKEKLKYLGFNKRLIDDLLVESLEAMGHTPCKDESLAPLKRLKTNIETLLNGTVPKEQMAKFRKENKSMEDILELLTNEKK
ncbi:zinc finger protein 37 homolog isoform X1 [Vanessa atalanta]|uniref:zinc finger protein 37 homolog isoform X1 n=1 Tax=Vanessa atalanta TaxID=42275 RepID=UPI001FCE090F|nr:zinc finger protein 37 homolog isoform X1 [Vanessa atalanta]